MSMIVVNIIFYFLEVGMPSNVIIVEVKKNVIFFPAKILSTVSTHTLSGVARKFMLLKVSCVWRCEGGIPGTGCTKG